MIATKKKTLSVQYLTRIAVLTALSSILFMISIPIVAFYSLDLSNLPVLLGVFHGARCRIDYSGIEEPDWVPSQQHHVCG